LALAPTTTTTTDDYALMQAVAAGDQTALAALYDRHSPLLFSLCLRILRNRQDAEDLLVDVFWELWSRSDRYDAGRGSPLTYLLTLARSRAIDRRRSGMKRRAIQFEADLTGDPSGSGTTAAGPVGHAIAGELAQKMKEAMARLDPAQRQAVEMSFYDGMSHSEIALKLGKPLGTVKTNIRQGLIHLREYIRME
jgi:RNA polymerase sigma-70 factor, ECF subfamily